jgi:hypothetical protein
MPNLPPALSERAQVNDGDRISGTHILGDLISEYRRAALASEKSCW